MPNSLKYLKLSGPGIYSRLGLSRSTSAVVNLSLSEIILSTALLKDRLYFRFTISNTSKCSDVAKS